MLSTGAEGHMGSSHLVCGWFQNLSLSLARNEYPALLDLEEVEAMRKRSGDMVENISRLSNSHLLTLPLDNLYHLHAACSHINTRHKSIVYGIDLEYSTMSANLHTSSVICLETMACYWVFL